MPKLIVWFVLFPTKDRIIIAAILIAMVIAVIPGGLTFSTVILVCLMILPALIAIYRLTKC